MMIHKLIRRSSHKAGMAPGSLIHVGERKIEQVKIRIMDYDADSVEEKEAKTVDECFPFKDKSTVTWINVDGLHQVDIVENLGKHFGLHPLLLEDILNTEQRPKMEEYGDYIFIVIKMFYNNKKDNGLESEQVSIVLGSNFVLSFQEKEGDVFEPVRERIRNAKGRVRKAGADYLAYAMLDIIVDNYFIVLENAGEFIEDTEEKLSLDPSPDVLQRIRKLKKEMIFLRKSIWPVRELVNGLSKGDSKLIQSSTVTYLRDIYDHTIQIIDTMESYRDTISGLLDIYLSSVNNKMNEVMKVLTIFASIFIPLTFVAGIYGMNFKYMPELDWHWSYFILLAIMAAIGITMLIYFRKKRWI